MWFKASEIIWATAELNPIRGHRHMMIDLEYVQNRISRINDVDVRLVSNLDQRAGYIQQLRQIVLPNHQKFKTFI